MPHDLCAISYGHIIWPIKAIDFCVSHGEADSFMEMIDYYSRCTGGINGKLWLDWVMEMVYSIRYPRIYQRNKFLEVSFEVSKNFNFGKNEN